jgi:hypothetical protein
MGVIFGADLSRFRPYRSSSAPASPGLFRQKQHREDDHLSARYIPHEHLQQSTVRTTANPIEPRREAGALWYPA